VPVGLGLLLGAILSAAEKKEALSLADRMLGARLPDNAWDIFLRRMRPEDLLIVSLVGGRTVAGGWTRGSFASSGDGEAPSIYLGGLWALNSSGVPVAPLSEPWDGIWIPRSAIETMARYKP